jgi:hypothetical protein
MSEQPPMIVGQTFALIAMLTWLYYFFKAREQSEQPTYMDGPRITLGYIVDEPVVDKSFYNECKMSLVSVGFKKSEANTITKKVFASSSPPTDVQTFLLAAMAFK